MVIVDAVNVQSVVRQDILWVSQTIQWHVGYCVQELMKTTSIGGTQHETWRLPSSSPNIVAIQ